MFQVQDCILEPMEPILLLGSELPLPLWRLHLERPAVEGGVGGTAVVLNIEPLPVSPPVGLR